MGKPCWLGVFPIFLLSNDNVRFGYSNGCRGECVMGWEKLLCEIKRIVFSCEQLVSDSEIHYN